MGKGPEIFDAIILGAGGAGLMCAATAGRQGRHVLVIDHADVPGKKILISGGGRCNFTNIHTSADRYLSSNPHFAKSALGRFRPEAFIALVDAHGIAWHEKTLGQLFCDGSARQIVDMLLAECAAGQVELALGNPVASVDHADGHFRVGFGTRMACAPALVVATGGLSIPKIGATGFAFDLARKFGLKLVEPRPALVPLTLGAQETLFTSLSGVSTEVVAKAGTMAFREAALFTHRGLSGPAILQASSYWRHRTPVLIDFLPDEQGGWLRAAKREAPRSTLRRSLSDRMPGRLAQVLADRLGLTGDLGGQKDKTLEAIERQLAEWAFHPTGTEGFAKAEVTAGGISTEGLSSQTMQAKRVPGLFAIGEAVDVTGWLGGYNFQWAWASGVAAGQAL